MLTRRELLIGGAALAACARTPAEEDKRVMTTEPKIKQAAELMQRFAERTGLTGEAAATRRYLWTDAFAVCNFIGLHRATGDSRWVPLAAKLVERVHEVLAPRRDLEHPTAAGLRIGKKLPERGVDDAYDEELEWDRDGQYFHYLTQWMHALDQLSHELTQPKLTRWACELAQAAHRAFVYGSEGKKRMYWKMSIDLTRPLVASMGQHDPLDGYATCRALATSWPPPLACSELEGAIADFRSMIVPRALATADPLGIGGLLVAAHRLHHSNVDRELVEVMIVAARIGLQQYAMQRQRPAEQRLGFRELGLAIGLAAAESLPGTELRDFRSLRAQIEEFWIEPTHRTNRTWREHEDINDVMLATALVPAGFLDRG
ncbi:MAG TPA: hypothetical protein VIV40_27885 [Kofleriaceae bacterium]